LLGDQLSVQNVELVDPKITFAEVVNLPLVGAVQTLTYGLVICFSEVYDLLINSVRVGVEA